VSGCVLGTGIDLVETARMRDTLERWNERFKARTFHPNECEYCDNKAFPWLHYAARFAVKEAVSKAFGTGIGPHIGLLDMEVKNDPNGKPSVILTDSGRRMAEERGVKEIMISLSHTHEYAVAQAILVGACGERAS